MNTATPRKFHELGFSKSKKVVRIVIFFFSFEFTHSCLIILVSSPYQVIILSKKKKKTDKIEVSNSLGMVRSLVTRLDIS